jgi:hypothetical protein
LDKFNGALTPEMIDYLVTATNQVLQQLRGATPQEIETLTAERQVVERELSNLVEFVIKGVIPTARGNSGPRTTVGRTGSGAGTATRCGAAGTQADQPRVDRGSAPDAQEVGGEGREIQKHIDDLRIAPAPDVGERVVRLTGRVKIDGLLGGEGPCAYNWLRGLDLNQRPWVMRAMSE